MKKKSALIILILSLVLIVTSIFLVWQKKKIIQDVPKQVVVSDEAIAAVDTSDWETYRNEGLGFEFRYPKEWGIDNNRSSQDTIVFSTGFNESREAITFLKNTEKVSSNEWFESNRQKHKGGILKESTLTIDGIDSIKLETGEFAQSFIIFSNEKGLFVITTMGLIEKKKILETLRFL